MCNVNYSSAIITSHCLLDINFQFEGAPEFRPVCSLTAGTISNAIHTEESSPLFLWSLNTLAGQFALITAASDWRLLHTVRKAVIQLLCTRHSKVELGGGRDISVRGDGHAHTS